MKIVSFGFQLKAFLIFVNRFGVTFFHKKGKSKFCYVVNPTTAPPGLSVSLYFVEKAAAGNLTPDVLRQEGRPT